MDFVSAQLFTGKAGGQYKLQIIEIYNEAVRDLQNVDNADLKVVEYKGQTIVEGAPVVDVQSAEQYKEYLEKALKNRAVGCTNLNERSSRSHLLIIIKLGKSQLTICDLAGSERISKTGAKDELLVQANSINSSLLVLGRVIQALVRKETRIAYRDSKLTRLLQNSLGGTAASLIIVCVSSEQKNIDETV